jgi:hypothetical protein
VKVAQVCDRARLGRGPARVRDRAGVAILVPGVEDHELDAGCRGSAERELGAADDVAAGGTGRAAERHAGEDP